MKGYFPAKVINNNDLKKKGRVQVKIEQFHYKFTDDMLPWAQQSKSSTGGSATYGKSEIPEVGSLVWVWFEDTDTFMRAPFYSEDVVMNDLHAHNLYDLNLKATLGLSGVYPDVKYTYYKNGVCIGVCSNATQPEVFISHPKASVVIKSTGDVVIKSQGKITTETTGAVTTQAGATALEKSVLGETLKLKLDAILDGIAAITVIDPQSGSPVPIVNIATFTAIKSGMSAILSPLIKNN